MAAYQHLRVLSYSPDFSIEEELRLRKNSYSTILTGFEISPMRQGEPVPGIKFELFCNPVAELRSLNERILNHSIEIRKLREQLPGIGREAILKKVLINEIRSTNEIEGVKSSRKEIRTAMNLTDGKKNRLHKIVEMYLRILESDALVIREPDDVREVYDHLFAGSDTIENPPDGKLFRKENIQVWKGMEKIHSGICGEENIQSEVRKMIAFMNREDVPFLTKACITHYILEYIHPFYDGNGRLGRFLLSSYLKRKLDTFSAISISYEINLKKSKYNELFKETSLQKNYGELTHFVIGMMELIEQGQKGIKKLLKDSLQKIRYLERLMKTYEDIDEIQCEILYYYLQMFAFNEGEEIEDKAILSFVKSSPEKKLSEKKFKERMADLEAKGYLVAVKKRPIIHELSDRLKAEME